MPTRPRPGCTRPGCPHRTPCPVHGLPPFRTERTVGLTRAERGYGSEWTRLRRLVLDEEPTCRLCNNESTTVDHIVPLAKGGTHRRSNLRALCERCHRRVTGEQS